MPGISGAIRTPVGIPARFSSATASRRARGLGVCGSVARHAFSSSVGIDRQALNSVRCASSRISVDIAQQQRRLGEHRARVAGSAGGVEHRFPDADHQSVAPLDPLVRIGVGAERDVLSLHDGRASSARSTSGALTLTTISRSKSRPASKPR